MSLEDQIPFMLGMFTVSASPAFPAIVLDDEAVVPLHAVLPLAARLGLALTGGDSLFGLLQNWDHNFEGLCATVMALNDDRLGRHYRSSFSALEFFQSDTPVPSPRQIFTELTIGASGGRFMPRLPSTVGGPHARIPLPEIGGDIVAEAKIGTVIGRPAYNAAIEDAEAAIAGYITVTDITNVTALLAGGDPDWLAAKSAPGFMPTGPYFIPAAFAAMEEAEMAITLNGETTVRNPTSAIALPFAAQVQAIAARCQLFPGDIIASGAAFPDWEDRFRPLGDGDIVETAVYGLGRQTLNSIRISRG